jgi:hypothetical protein
MEIDILRYPVGKVTRPENYTEEYRANAIKTIEELPAKLKAAVANIDKSKLTARYRPDGWSVQQVIHHLADSHINSFTRFKLALTEDAPTIKPYEEKLWAEMTDANDQNIEDSIMIITGVHARWVRLLKSMNTADWDKVFLHPEGNRSISLNFALTIYDWHCRHHLQHIINAINNGY